MNRIRSLSIALAVAALAGSGAAQTKLGCINAQEVFEKSSEGKKVTARLQEAERQNTTALARLDDEIRALQTKLQAQKLTLTEVAAAQLTSDLDKKTIERKRKAEDAYAAWNELRDRLFQKLQEELLAIIGQLGKENGYDLIIDVAKSGAAYWSPAVDLSVEVIKRYDASKASVK
ncbi:MAG: OmpH family outer membrane protein [Candidatus Aminicenantes bacterium]|nr:OmpH family outer membrane protein [Candidatus Aminicenantes bacterium]